HPDGCETRVTTFRYLCPKRAPESLWWADKACDRRAKRCSRRGSMESKRVGHHFADRGASSLDLLQHPTIQTAAACASNRKAYRRANRSWDQPALAQGSRVRRIPPRGVQYLCPTL